MSDKSILKELMVAQHNPIGMFTRENRPIVLGELPITTVKD